MLMKSTGLGRTELEGFVKGLDFKNDFVIIHMKTTDPVKWHVRVAVNFPEVLTMGRFFMFSWKAWKFIILQLLRAMIRPFRKNKELIRPDDF